MFGEVAAIYGMTPELAVRWSVPSDPQMSPDGKHVAFVVSDVGRIGEHPCSTVWVADLALGACHRFTAGPREDASPRWSPDGTHLAFLSDRDEPGKLQLYVLAAGGGESELLVAMPGGVSEPRWSPDGSWIGFRAKDPEPEEDVERRRDRRDEIVADRDARFDRLYIAPSTGGEPRLVSRLGPTRVLDFDWAPSGRALVAATVVTTRTNEEHYGPSRLEEYTLEGEIRALLGHPLGISEPIWSPDGRTIAYRAKAGRVEADDALFCLSVAGGPSQHLTPGYRGSVLRTGWSPDSRSLRFMGLEDLWGVLREVRVDSLDLCNILPDRESRQGTFHGLSFSADGTGFALVRSSTDQPPNIWVGEIGKPPRCITRLNQSVTVAGLARAERLEWSSVDGMRISGLLYRPRAADDLAPLVVQVHGGPASAWSDRFAGNWHDWAQLLVARGFAVLLPNPRGSIGRGREFTDAEIDDMGGMELADILTGVDYVLERGGLDPDRLGIGGWSHGGYMSAWAVANSDRFRAAVVGAGVSNMVSDHGQNDIPAFNKNYFTSSIYEAPLEFWRRSPMSRVRQIRTPTLILHGEKDERVALPQAQELYRALAELKVPVEFVTYPREGHAIQERGHQHDLIRRVLDWFERYLKPQLDDTGDPAAPRV